MRKPILFFILTLLFQVNGYSAFSQNNLLGKWLVSSATRREGATKITLGPLYPVIDKEGVARADKMKWIVTEDSITILYNDKQTTIPYEWQRMTDIYSFTYYGRPYEVQLYVDGDIRILQETQWDNIFLLRRNEN